VNGMEQKSLYFDPNYVQEYPLCRRCEVAEKVAAGDRRTQVSRQWLCWWRQGIFPHLKVKYSPGKEGGDN
jgi:hypothetical protein